MEVQLRPAYSIKNVFKEYNNKHFNDDFSLTFPLTFIAIISINDPLF